MLLCKGVSSVDTGHHLAHKDTPESLLRQWFCVGQSVELPGTRGNAKVMGFAKKYIERGGFGHKRAGVYFDFTALRIVKKNGAEELWDAEVFLPHGSAQHKELSRKIEALEIRACDLPDTPFWVGDIVRKDIGRRQETFSDGIIAIVNYDHTPTSYRVTTGLNTPSQTEFWSDAYLTLVERGNIWKLEHGEPLSFHGDTEAKRLDEEAAFYKSLGMSRKVIFTDMESELWPLSGGIRELQAGRADRLIVKDNRVQGVVLIKYDNEEFGNRMRAAELKRLGFEAEKRPLGSGIKRI